MVFTVRKIPRERVMICKRLYAKMSALRSILLIMKDNKELVQKLDMSEKDFYEAKDAYMQTTQAFEEWWDDVTEEYNLPARDDERYQSNLSFISCDLVVTEKK